jgi:hypothetical protein
VAFSSSSLSGNRVFAVADHLELDPVPAAQLARQPGGAHRLVGRVAAGGVGQQQVALLVDLIEQIVLAALVEVHPPQRHGHHLGAGDLERAQHGRRVAVLPSPQDQP